jgi:ketosteroid isomerase-like protein
MQQTQTTQETQNTKVVQDGYAAFGRGDIPGVLEEFTDSAAINAAHAA